MYKESKYQPDRADFYYLKKNKALKHKILLKIEGYIRYYEIHSQILIHT